VDVRIVAATNRDLERVVDEGSFRSDLYYRLSVFRSRFRRCATVSRTFPRSRSILLPSAHGGWGDRLPLSPAVMDALKRWTWPGNIRELQNVIERGVIQSPGADFVLPLQDVQPKTRASVSSSKPAATLKDAERDAIVKALRESGGVIAGPTGAAARLGLRRTTLQGKMRRLGIRRPSF
jgi:formate hydrogenlyase transcriptional activator